MTDLLTPPSRPEEEGSPIARLNRLVAQLVGLVEQRLWMKVLLGLFLGALTGALLGRPAKLFPPGFGPALTNWLALPGDLFIRLVQMIMIPLIIASIVAGIAGGGQAANVAKLGLRVGVYFLGTTVVAILIGLAVVLAISPGQGISLELPPGAPRSATTDLPLENLPGVLSGLVPTNPLASMLAGEMLSLVIFALIVGAALVAMPRDKSEPILDLLASVQEICMTVTKWAMKLAPVAVFGLMARTTAKSGLGVLAGLGWYVLTVVTALLVLLALYLLVIAFLPRISVRHFIRSIRDVLLLAFSVASSAAVMPLSMKTAEEKLGVPPHVARFVVPLGAIMNMNGTAAYQAVATVFLAQVYGLELGAATLTLVVVTAVAASIGTPSAPGAGIIVLASVLSSAGVPTEGISVIIGVDHLLGMCRTAVNVAGDLTACTLFSHTVGEPVQPAPPATTGAP